MLASLVGIQRFHMSTVDSEHMRELALILKIARALGCSSTELMAETESRLAAAES